MGGHTNSLDYQVSPEHLNKMVKGNLLPTLEEAFNIMDESFHEWSGIFFKGSQPYKKYSTNLEHTKEEQRMFSQEKDVDAFWYQPGKMIQVKDTTAAKQKTRMVFKPQEYSYSNKGIIVEKVDPLTKEKRHYVFDIPDATFNAQNITAKFTIKIEPEHFSCARIYQDGKPVLDAKGDPILATSKQAHPSAQVDHSGSSRIQLANELERKKQQREIATEQFDRYMEIAEKKGFNEPIDASWVHGKEIAGPAQASLNEQRLAAITKGKEEEMEEEPELVPVETVDEDIRRF